MKLAVTGYYGVKNLGDDAFVSVLKEHLAGLNPTFTAGKFAGDETHVVVGGGEFEPWMIAAAPKTAKFYAVGIGLIRDGCGEDRARLLHQFERIWVRDPMSFDLCKLYSITASLVPDLAILLKPRSGGRSFAGRTVFCPCHASEYMKDVVRLGLPDDAVIAPMHPNDMVLDPKHEQVLISTPEEYLFALQGAAQVVSWGKLHCCVLAHVAETPWVCIDSENVKCEAFLQSVYTGNVGPNRLIGVLEELYGRLEKDKELPR